MKMTRRIVMASLIAALVLGLSGCVLSPVEAAEDRTESRDVSGFDAVDFAGIGNLEVVQGSRYELELSGSGDVLDRVRTEVSGDTLRIDSDNGWWPWLFRSNVESIDVKLTVPELSRLEVSGLGEVNIDEFAGDSFEFRLSGAGELQGRNIDFDELVVELSGAGKVDLSGRARSQEIRISGAGEYDARDLESADALVVMSGAGSAKIWATDTLDAEASGAGSVDYWGDTNVTSDVSGAGSIHDRGAR